MIHTLEYGLTCTSGNPFFFDSITNRQFMICTLSLSWYILRGWTLDKSNK